MSEKASIEQVTAESAVEENSLKSPKGLAYGGDDTLPPPPTLSAAEEKKLWRKIDMRLMPILTLMYLCSFLDRGNIGEYTVMDGRLSRSVGEYHAGRED